MRLQEIRQLVLSTSDPAFAIDGFGSVVAWNQSAENLFGIDSYEAVGRQCAQILRGEDECGRVCSSECTVQQSVRNHRPMSNFDLQVETRNGRQWCNISVMITDEAGSAMPYSIHILRPIDMRKRLEIMMRDFVVSATNLPPDQAIALLSAKRAPTSAIDLTNREVEILRHLAKGATSTKIANALHISRTTVNNHIQHVFKKLDAHTRLEAVRKAEHAGMI